VSNMEQTPDPATSIMHLIAQNEVVRRECPQNA
jgi:hypothetical protein